MSEAGEIQKKVNNKEQPSKAKETINFTMHSLGISDRLGVRLTRGLEILDSEMITQVTGAVEKIGFGFIRGRLPKKFAYPSSDKYESSISRNIMLKVSKDEKGLRLRQIPAMHVVTGSSPDLPDYWWDPQTMFLHSLKYGFSGGGTMNTYLLDTNYEEMLKKYGYEGNYDKTKVIYSKRPEFYGDKYKLIMWRSFTRNYTSDSETDIRVLSYGQGTVKYCPADQLEAYIFLAEGADERVRIESYTKAIDEIGAKREKPIQVINADLKIIGQI